MKYLGTAMMVALLVGVLVTMGLSIGWILAAKTVGISVFIVLWVVIASKLMEGN